jgi:diadenosine tetraphosphate (Ap4A) HIT family hydrolase
MKYTEDNCPFCHPDKERVTILSSANAFAIYDRFPVNPGHALIIPSRHCADYFDLSEEEQAACVKLLNNVKAVIEKEFKPDGFNIGINIGEYAGQTVPHVHIHLIPRYKGDVPNPLGGVRGVIPSKKEY